MKQKLPIGTSDFREIRENGDYYVDKTHIIHEVIEASDKVILLPRPRRFGKTLNLSTLRYFFQTHNTPAENHAALFNGLAIAKSPYWATHQGQYPTLFITFKDIVTDSWEDMLAEMANRLADLVTAHKYLLTSDKVEERWQNQLLQVYNQEAPTPTLARSLMVLTHALHAHHGQPAMVLIDEYDSPILRGYQEDYHSKVVNFMRSMMAAVFKDNSALYRGVITGILRVAKESIFSGLNNLTTHTVLDTGFHTAFGLTTTEVKGMLADYGRSNEYNQVANWYNGYLFGGTEIYNPWSIIHYLDKPAWGLFPHWTNSSGNELVKTLIQQTDPSLQQALETLLQGKPVVSELQRFTVFKDLETPTPPLILSFLVFSGYLKAQLVEKREARYFYALSIPNIEVKSVYVDTFIAQLAKPLGHGQTNHLLAALLQPNPQLLGQLLQEYVLSAFSYYDVPATAPEQVYHSFMLGILAHLSATHTIQSNRETGYGRADVLMIPRDTQDPKGYVLEFKKAQEGQALETVARQALSQAGHKAYTQPLKDHGKTQLHTIGIAFRGKEVAVAGSTQG